MFFRAVWLPGTARDVVSLGIGNRDVAEELDRQLFRHLAMEVQEFRRLLRAPVSGLVFLSIDSIAGSAVGANVVR